MFDRKRAAIICLLLLLGGCSHSPGDFATLPKNTVVGYQMEDFNDYVNDVNRNTRAPRWAGEQQADAEIVVLKKTNKIITLSSDTKVERLGTDDSFTYVRILEGAHRNQEVWTGAQIDFKPQH